eukprot:TRINITY_DN1893_c0_g2_i1.p1 TRINITY_DN1893_c0_g2~~TRINITY_DN1893_c0_g2_i1.p1  ORF type:complete len:456 (-),score=121.84 TRINITY_DN1893_c0_g2_i1:16-1383(-)
MLTRSRARSQILLEEGEPPAKRLRLTLRSASSSSSSTTTTPPPTTPTTTTITSTTTTSVSLASDSLASVESLPSYLSPSPSSASPTTTTTTNPRHSTSSYTTPISTLSLTCPQPPHPATPPSPSPRKSERERGGHGEVGGRCDELSCSLVGEIHRRQLLQESRVHLKEKSMPYFASHCREVSLANSCAHREILLEWLCEVAEEMQLRSSTLFLAMHLIDCFRNREDIGTSKLQLLGTTALYVAVKYAETHQRPVNEFEYVTDSTCSVPQILAFESHLLEVLQYRLTFCTVDAFLETYLSGVSGVDEELRQMCLYLAKLYCVCTNTFSSFHSELAKNCILAAVFLLRRSGLVPQLESFWETLEEPEDDPPTDSSSSSSPSSSPYSPSPTSRRAPSHLRIKLSEFMRRRLHFIYELAGEDVRGAGVGKCLQTLRSIYSTPEHCRVALTGKRRWRGSF